MKERPGDRGQWVGRKADDVSVAWEIHVMCRSAGRHPDMPGEVPLRAPRRRGAPKSGSMLPPEVHESFVRQLSNLRGCRPGMTPSGGSAAGSGHRPGNTLIVTWQGGGAVLPDLGFFRRSVLLQKSCRKPGMRIENRIVMDGVFLTEQWCELFRENGFAVILRMDGPGELHGPSPRSAEDRKACDRLLASVTLMNEHKVRCMVLCTVGRLNGRYPLMVYRFFRDELSVRQVRFQPLVERSDRDAHASGEAVTNRSVRPHQWGVFLEEIFDEWIERDMGKVHVQNFEALIEGTAGRSGTCCELMGSCGHRLALDRKGNLYPCERFMDPGHCLGNILSSRLEDLACAEGHQMFAQNKQAALPGACRECPFLSSCFGECPKNRFIASPLGEAGLNYLCAGYRAFFRHAGPALKAVSECAARKRPAERTVPLQESGSMCPEAGLPGMEDTTPS